MVVNRPQYWGAETPKTVARSNKAQKVFGIVLRELRNEAGYSQDSFAHLTGYHRNYIGQLERGEKSPSLAALFDFARSFGLRPSQLLQKMESKME